MRPGDYQPATSSYSDTHNDGYARDYRFLNVSPEQTTLMPSRSPSPTSLSDTGASHDRHQRHIERSGQYQQKASISSQAPATFSRSSLEEPSSKTTETTGHPRAPSQNKSHSFGTYFREWRWELFGWVLGTVISIILITLLILYNDTPVQRWSSIQFTAIIAALAQASQSALLVPTSYCISQLKWKWFRRTRNAIDLDTFDLASRGPYGSLKLLFTVPWNQNIVWLGSWATLLLVVFSTFIQQSVVIILKDVRSDSIGRIPQALTYNISAENIQPTSSSASFGTRDIILASAIKNGLIQQNIGPSDVSGDCPAERCDWFNYQTLAVCADVEDVSSLLVQANRTGSSPDLRAENRLANPPPFGGSDTFHVKTARLTYTTASKENLTDAAHVYLVHADPCAIETYDDQWDVKSYRAYRARFRLCVQTLNSTFNSTMSTTILDSTADAGWYHLLENGSTPDTSCVSAGSDDICITEAIHRSVTDELWYMFNQSAFILPNASTNFGDEWSIVLARDVLGNDVQACNNQSGIGLDGFAKRMNNVAGSLSNALRTADSSKALEGEAFLREQYFRIDFVWLAMPATVWVIVTIFLLATMFEMRSTPLWAQSPLIYLRSLDPRNRIESLSKLEGEAKRMHLQLVPTESSWFLDEKSNSGNGAANKAA